MTGRGAQAEPRYVRVQEREFSLNPSALTPGPVCPGPFLPSSPGNFFQFPLYCLFYHCLVGQALPESN